MRQLLDDQKLCSNVATHYSYHTCSDIRRKSHTPTNIYFEPSFEILYVCITILLLLRLSVLLLSSIDI